MSLFEMAAGSCYVRVTFDTRELSVIRAACASVAEQENHAMADKAGASLEEAAGQAKKASEFAMADQLVALFKPGQEVLIEREDLEPVLACLKAYGQSSPEEHASTLKSVIEKIERSSKL